MGRQIIANASVRWASALGRGSKERAESWGIRAFKPVRDGVGHAWLERWKKAWVRWSRGADRAQRPGHRGTDYKRPGLPGEREAQDTFLH